MLGGLEKNMSNIFIASDHAGLELKEAVLTHLKQKGFNVEDLGPNKDSGSVDYPDYAKKVCKAVLENKALGILICGTGIGMSISANKVRGIRAALVSESFSAKMAKRHNNANIICIGSRVVGVGLALEVVDAWLASEYESGRHQNRLDKIE